MARHLVLDTETTGLDPRTGHRLIEIACVEVIDFIPTNRSFHEYVHPDREIDADAERVHGISLAFLKDKPRFHEIVDKFLDFVGDDPIVAHNAPFDRSFVNAELQRLGRTPPPDDRWIDTLALAKKKFPGMYNSLDALCKRMKISLASRDKHGALIDAELLAAVYLELQGGKERALDLTVETVARAQASIQSIVYGARPRPLAPRSTEQERAAHEAFVRGVLKDKAVWLKYGI
ncbi:DNA polymerase III subunit epsilon [Caulobacter mirabilis]|uniref:DNA polymerase III subunit epsilon n=1 Tax=Caulobacter mirabilis TaxID=69666 RepID=A0A2D2B318_9CAUL|nr:DNA polymerase III subunit epsilon [Caulobacter mirabilis]ATQ44637.1 DNA polymerase III subunit epsilon [Caulobacter mirabilis]